MSRSSLNVPLPVLCDQLRDLLQIVQTWTEVDALLDGVIDWPGVQRSAEDALASADSAYNATIEADVGADLLQTRQEAWVEAAGAWLRKSRAQWAIAAGDGDRAAAEIARRLPIVGNPRFSGRKKAMVAACGVVDAHRGFLTAPPAWLPRSDAAAGELLQAAADLDRKLVPNRALRSAAAASTASSREAARRAIQRLRAGWELARMANRFLPALRMVAVERYWERRALEVGGGQPSEDGQPTGTGHQRSGTTARDPGSAVQQDEASVEGNGTTVQGDGTGHQGGGTGLHDGGRGHEPTDKSVRDGGRGVPTPAAAVPTAVDTHTGVLDGRTDALDVVATALETRTTTVETRTTVSQAHTTMLDDHPTLLSAHPTVLQTFGALGGPLPQVHVTPTDESDP